MQLPDRKRRHHTVWQFYLKAWERGGAVGCLRKGRTFSTGTTAIGVRTDFYAMKELSSLEEAYVRKFGIENTDPVGRQLNERWLSTFLLPFQLRRRLEAGGLDPTRAEQAIELLVSNGEEELQTQIESRSIPHLEALRVGDLGFLQAGGSDRDEFLHFLCVQYFRTPKLQANVIEAARVAPGIRGEHIWPVLRHIYATSMTLGLARQWDDLRVDMLRPPPGSEFVTSDQPVINLCAVGTPRFEEVKELIFYYPVAPNRALLLDGSRERRFEKPDLSAEQVDQLNHAMIATLYEQAFATNEELLQRLSS